ncbi:hypothetical protein B0J17DRAFT_626547 [Rhizoctonia solani]|nr:hypothetical protein B0J17DRAFT_626547 [Rhizoctonia solani]
MKTFALNTIQGCLLSVVLAKRNQKLSINHINPKGVSRTLPSKPRPPKRPNTAIVVFNLDWAAQKIVQSSCWNKAGPFWQNNALEAQMPQMVESVVKILSNKKFSRPNLNQKSNRSSLHSKALWQPTGS